jgi:hypothetical protein
MNTTMNMTTIETLTTFSGSPTEHIKFDGLYNNEYAMMNYRTLEDGKGIIHYHTYNYITNEIAMHEKLLDGLYKNEEKNPNDVILQKRIYDKENYLREFKRANKAFTILHHEQRMEWARLNLERMEEERMERWRTATRKHRFVTYWCGAVKDAITYELPFNMKIVKLEELKVGDVVVQDHARETEDVAYLYKVLSINKKSISVVSCDQDGRPIYEGTKVTKSRIPLYSNWSMNIITK